jgi:hypothetical protein
MQENGKLLRLFGTIFFSILAVIAVLVLVFLGMRLVFGLLNYIPWLSYVYTLLLLSVPAALLVSVFILFFKRTKFHPVRAVRVISYTIFCLFILSWVYVFIADMIRFIKKGSAVIGDYLSYDTVFLALNVAFIFIVGVIQALTMPPEKDWMEKRKRDEME